MISTSEKANPNYLAKIIEVKGLRKHPNADRLQILTVDFQNVITGMETPEGDIYVFFPLESAINLDFLKATNSFRDKEMNEDPTQTGFFESKGRVRAVKLRGEKSMGYIVPAKSIEAFTGKTISDRVGEEFDTVGDILMVKKYEVYRKPMYTREGKKPRISRLVEGQVRLHVDTENFRRNAFMLSPEDEITVSYKIHGTSFWVSNVIVKKKLSWVTKALRAVGVPVVDTEYDHVYGSRKVVKNEYETQDTQDFYEGDVWGDIKDEIKEFVPKGYTLYGEAVGYTKTGQAIQGEYDYGCAPGTHKLQIYRITFTNPDGIVMDLSSKQVQEFCDRAGLQSVHIYYRGKAKDMYPELSVSEHWHQEFVTRLEKDYNEKDCFLCINKVPEEGIVLRKEKLHAFEAYKLKSFRFLEYETALLDKEVQELV